MKNLLLILMLCLFGACQENEQTTDAKPGAKPKIEPMEFLLGSYTNQGSEGIYRFIINAEGQLQKLGLVVKSIQPSFLAYSKDRKFVVAVNEVNDQDGKGTVESFKVEGDQLLAINKQSSGGAHPCHVNINEDGFVLTSNYSGGNIGMHRLAQDGKLSELLDIEDHNGTDKGEAHAHSAWFYGDNNDVVSVDLGTDELWFARIDAKKDLLQPRNPATLFIKEGAGPRHLTFHPNGRWAYVINELNSTISLISVIDQWEQLAAYSTLPEGFSDESFCADIHISQDGKFLYGSNRGHNSIVIYAVNETDGTLSLIGHESVRGDWPRNFALTPDDNFLIVANQRSNNLVAFKRDTASGLLSFTGEIGASEPTCILF